MKNILVFRTHRFGDILQTFPMVQGLREKYHPCRIFYVVDENYHELVEKSDLVDEVIPIPYTRFLSNCQDKNLTQEIVERNFKQEIDRLKREKIHLAINRSYTKTSALFIAAVHPEKCAGKQFHPEKGYYFDDISVELMKNVNVNRESKAVHLVDFGCQIADVSPGTRQIQFIPDSNDFAWWTRQIQGLALNGKEILIGIQMGARASFRHWGVEKYARVIEEFRQICKQKRQRVIFLLFGNAEEMYAANKIISLVMDKKDILNFAGKTTFGQLGIALAHCRMLLSVDTGTLHLATAVNTPVLGIYYGSAFYRETGPYGVGHFLLAPEIPCYPCYDPNKCPINLQCRELITPQIVIESLKMIFEIAPFHDFSHVKFLRTQSVPIRYGIEYSTFE